MHWLPLILILPYLYLLLRIFRSLLKIKPYKTTTDPSSFVSVVVACRNEEESLPLLLRCIADQEYPTNLFEVIIVDDNSTDGTIEKTSGIKEPGNIIVLRNNGVGKKQAIRTGIKASSGKLIITTDADCRMGGKWIKTIAAFYDQNKPDMIICPVQIESGRGFFGRFQELEFLSLQGVTAGSAFGGEATMCNGANLSFTREAYLNHSENMHDEIASGDDVFLLHSMKKDVKSRILWLESEDAMVITAASSTTKPFFRQRSRWISKRKEYDDNFTILLGIVTFVAIALQISFLVAGVFNPSLLWVFLAIFIIKSIPDFLILQNTSKRYGKRKLMNWFIPSQIIYPFYVLGVVCYSLISNTKQRH